MKRIGMIVAVEMEPVLEKFGAGITGAEEKAGYRIVRAELENCELIICNCGAGEIAAASGTQFLICVYHVDMVVNFGIVGGLTPEMARTGACIVEKAVHYDFDTSAVDDVEPGRYLDYPDVYLPASREPLEVAASLYPDLMPVICASGDKFIADPEKKKELNERYGAVICEMEAAAVILTCNRNGVPCLLIKMVADAIGDGKNEYWQIRDTAASMCLETALKVIGSL